MSKCFLFVLIIISFVGCKREKDSFENIEEVYTPSVIKVEGVEDEIIFEEESYSLKAFFNVYPEPIGFIHLDDITVVSKVSSDTLNISYQYPTTLYRDLVYAKKIDDHEVYYHDSVILAASFLKEVVRLQYLLDAVPLVVREESSYYIRNTNKQVNNKVIPIKADKRKYDLESYYFPEHDKLVDIKGAVAFIRLFERFIQYRNSKEIDWYAFFSNNKKLFYSILPDERFEEVYFSLRRLEYSYEELSNNSEVVSELYYSLMVDEYSMLYPTYKDLNIVNPQNVFNDDTMIPLKIGGRALRKPKEIVKESLDLEFMNCHVNDYDYFLKRSHPEWYYTFWIRRAIEGHDNEIYRIILEIISDYETDELKALWNKKLNEITN
ncbi:hypothetical protein HX052_05750 [Myroides marinus]|uniref:Uncharacterized protein n=1 Tax=Myroides marinus TaxID=703342 RepID=A0A1H6S0Z0_9FLAO|nr:hypothetical protein [Myroides marinus]MDM1369861.1 hypothetical protein [Myroides marinus]MDM1372520.1 hypothetical protein [Myroides marinus]MDM1376822.1 hypothetical protein [Myroides marinus]MDM1384141.1 hypothetical protein [Myroides marinus]MDM1389474.1 hypothetical protein [Myroides marinus]